MNETHADTIDHELTDAPGAPLLAELVAYWEEKRRGRIAPRRGDIDPAELRRHLPYVHMLDVIDDGADFRFRLIGTAIVEGLGRDSTGKTFGEMFGARPEVMARLCARFRVVVREKRPTFSRGRMFWHPDRAYREFVAASVPLSEDGVSVNIILSELIPVPGRRLIDPAPTVT